MARYIAKNFVAAGICEEMTLQLAYAIGVSQPVSVYVNTVGNHTSLSDAELAGHISDLFDLSPKAITELLHLNVPIYEETAAYGHFGRECGSVGCFGGSHGNVVLFPWEGDGCQERLKNHFSEYMV